MTITKKRWIRVETAWSEISRWGSREAPDVVSCCFSLLYAISLRLACGMNKIKKKIKKKKTFSPVTGGRSLILPSMLLFLFNTMVVRFEYFGMGVSLLFAIVTSTISGIQPILRQTLVGDVFIFSLIL